jgi:hypothetical protein
VTSGPKNDRAERWPEAAATSTGIVLKGEILAAGGWPTNSRFDNFRHLDIICVRMNFRAPAMPGGIA